mmetsp:Transcript_19324/g.25457  ORF Transcript_19324/g.25457 Transcript_19324/m.25457 type:complete len:424 (+) Transcript_19324:251-1522(+)
MNFDGIQHSVLVQRRIGAVSTADREFARVDGPEIPIVLVPKWPWLYQTAVNVPSGPHVLWQKWHKNKGELQPGVKWFWPAWNRISHVITKATITYNAPAKACPTADNVMVNVDLSLTFKIGPDAEGAKQFVYSMGAHRFDEFLAAKTEEAIRGLVYSVTHDKVNDLREEFASGMLSTLNSQTSPYGVSIMNVKITEVFLPDELQRRLERTTAFRTKMEEAEKVQENAVVVQRDRATQELETIRKNNNRRLQNLTAEIKRYEIELAETLEAARGKAKVEETNAQSKAEVMITKAAGDKEVSKVNGQRDAEEKIRQMEIQCQQRRMKADQDAQTMILESEAKLAAAANRAQALIATAEAERKATTQLAEKRRYELEWERLRVLKQIAGKGRKFISGEQGQEILAELTQNAKTDAKASGGGGFLSR